MNANRRVGGVNGFRPIIALIEQSFDILEFPKDPCAVIEMAARTCYKSGDRVKPGSAEALTKRLISKGHEAMIEFASATVSFITDRGVTHELVRHRLCSFAQESTRYVKYGGGKTTEFTEFIEPVWYGLNPDADRQFRNACFSSAYAYTSLIRSGWRPEQARQVLNNAIKTEIVVKANLREWRHIFKLRVSKKAHPQIRSLMTDLLHDFQSRAPEIFGDL